MSLPDQAGNANQGNDLHSVTNSRSRDKTDLNCRVRHRTWAATARCRWPFAEVTGDGPFAVIVRGSRPWRIRLVWRGSEAQVLRRKLGRRESFVMRLEPHGDPVQSRKSDARQVAARRAPK